MLSKFKDLSVKTSIQVHSLQPLTRGLHRFLANLTDPSEEHKRSH